MKFLENNRFSQKVTAVSAVLLIGMILTTPRPWRSAAAAGIETTIGTNLVVPVDPRATFLHTAMCDNPDLSDDPFTPTVVNLAEAGLTPGTEIKLTYQILQPFSFICGSEMPKYDDPLFIAVFSSSNNLLPPQMARRVPDALKAGDEVRTGPVGIAET